MARRLGMLLLACALGLGSGSFALGAGRLFGRLAGQSPGGTASEAKSPIPSPGQRPYYGQALGATYYNYGYFGAVPRVQHSRAVGYYGEYMDCIHQKGY